MQADNLIKEEAWYLRLAMGHEEESFHEYVEAHCTCLNDIIYLPARNAYGLSSVAGNVEKLAALQNDFENAKDKLDDASKKAQRLEAKIKVLTKGYESRAEKLWNQIHGTYNKLDTAGTELECFQALKKQEQLASSNRINNIWEEVQKQKELEQRLQRKYGDLVSERERIQHLVEQYRAQEEEIVAKNRALELSNAEEAAANESAKNVDSSALSDENTLSVIPSSGETPSNETDTGNYQTSKSPSEPDMVESEPHPPSADESNLPNPDENPTTADSTAASSTGNEVPETVDEQVKTPNDEIMNEENDTHQEKATGDITMAAVDDVHEVNRENISQEDILQPKHDSV